MNQARAVVEAVAKDYGIERDRLTMRCDKREGTQRRHVAAYLCRTLVQASLTRIGAELGMHHTSVLHALRTIESRMKVEDDLRWRVLRLKVSLGDLGRMPREAKPYVNFNRLAGKRTSYVGRRVAPPRSAQGSSRCASRNEESSSIHGAMLDRFGFDGTDAPRPGAACAWCRETGHFCQARGFCGEDAVCRECGEMRPCGQALARVVTPPTMAEMFGGMR